MIGKVYIVLARDPKTRDDIVFGVTAKETTQVEPLIKKFYREQDWGVPSHLTVKSFYGNAVDPILFVGHAHAEYQKLEEQVSQLCQKLLEVADWYEGATGSLHTRDEIYAFVEDFEIGKKIVEEKYTPKEEGEVN